MNQDTQNLMNVILNNADPKLMVIDFEAHDKRAAEMRATRDKAQPTKIEPARVEYNRLRQQLFDLQQNAKNMEVYFNERAGMTRLLEHRITELIKHKKAAAEVGNAIGERTYENGIQLLETELFDSKVELRRASLQSGRAGHALKAFDGHQRIAELKKELGIAV